MPDYKFIKYVKLNDGKKKYSAVFKNLKTGKEKNVKFGAYGMEDYTIHKDKKRKELYDKRHKARENWNNPLTSGYHAKWVLWNLPDLKKSMNDTYKKMKKLGY